MAEDPDHSASHWLQRLPEEQPEAFKVPVTHVQSSQLVQLVLDPEVAKTITMAKACRVFSTYGAVASINLSDCSRHGLVEVSHTSRRALLKLWSQMLGKGWQQKLKARMSP